MHTPPPTHQPAQRMRRTSIALCTMACAALLGGCSIWPKALTFGADPEPVQAQPEAAPGATVCADCLGSTPATPSVAVPTYSAAVPAPLVPQAAPAATALADTAKDAVPTPAKTVPSAAAPERFATTNTSTKMGALAGSLVPGFYINVGLFAVPTNGTQVYKKLEDANLPVFSDSIKTKQGNLTRVRVGPFTTRAEADAAAKQIHTLKLDAVVFKH